ncbi:MAG: hypothetical protein ACI9ZH_000576, partial [Paracoccaceae bacterium]
HSAAAPFQDRAPKPHGVRGQGYANLSPRPRKWRQFNTIAAVAVNTNSEMARD